MTYVQTTSTLALTPATLIPVVAGLLMTLLLAALDATIVATAMPSIAADLHGVNRCSWVTAAYLLSSTVCVPVVSKLVDQYDRRVFLIGGTLAYLAGSLLCAVAGSFEQLVAFRFLQGAGANTITAAVFAAVPRLFAATQAARLIGLFATFPGNNARSGVGFATISGESQAISRPPTPLLGGARAGVFHADDRHLGDRERRRRPVDRADRRTRPVAVVEMLTGAVGACLLAGMGTGTEYAVVIRNLVIAGVGLGLALSAFVLSAQNALPRGQAGVAVGLSTFARAIGATLPSAALGALLSTTSGASGISAGDPAAVAAGATSSWSSPYSQAQAPPPRC